jgi:ABC-2 type transport system permease protein
VSLLAHPDPATSAPSSRAPSAAATLRAVIRRGLRDNRRAPLTWGGPLGAMSALMVAIWPSIEDSMDQLMESYPAELKDAFNIRELTTVEAYIDAEMLSFIVPLALAFLAIRVIVRMVSGAEERGYLDIVLTTPVARWTLAAGATAVAAIVAAVVLAVVTVMTWFAGFLFGVDPSLEILARGMANVWPPAVFFAGLAVLVSGRAHSGGPVTGIAAGTLVAMYIVDLAGKLADPIEPLRALTVFKYYGSAIQDGIDPFAFAGVTLVGAALAAAGAWLFERRDVL